MTTIVLDLGGSIVTGAEGPDIPFLKQFCSFWNRRLEEDPGLRLIIVVGGGTPARLYQQAFRLVTGEENETELDEIGIAATRLNARLLKAFFRGYCPDEVVIDPSRVSHFEGRVLLGAGWKPGFSTDYDAVLLAETFRADFFLNLSNIRKIYTGDPRKDPSVRPLDRLSWKKYRSLIADTWSPGGHFPFDPVAAAKAEEINLKVIVADGRDLDNVASVLKGEPFTGTIVGTEDGRPTSDRKGK